MFYSEFAAHRLSGAQITLQPGLRAMKFKGEVQGRALLPGEEPPGSIESSLQQIEVICIDHLLPRAVDPFVLQPLLRWPAVLMEDAGEGYLGELLRGELVGDVWRARELYTTSGRFHGAR